MKIQFLKIILNIINKIKKKIVCYLTYHTICYDLFNFMYNIIILLLNIY